MFGAIRHLRHGEPHGHEKFSIVRQIPKNQRDLSTTGERHTIDKISNWLYNCLAWKIPDQYILTYFIAISSLSLKYLQFNAMVYCLKKKFYPSIAVLFIYCVGGQLFAIQVFKIIGLAFKCSNRINTQYNRFRHFYFQIMYKNYDKQI